jgi:hypothetical protein
MRYQGRSRRGAHGGCRAGRAPDWRRLRSPRCRCDQAGPRRPAIARPASKLAIDLAPALMLLISICCKFDRICPGSLPSLAIVKCPCLALAGRCASRCRPCHRRSGWRSRGALTNGPGADDPGSGAGDYRADRQIDDPRYRPHAAVLSHDRYVSVIAFRPLDRDRAPRDSSIRGPHSAFGRLREVMPARKSWHRQACPGRLKSSSLLFTVTGLAGTAVSTSMWKPRLTASLRLVQKSRWSLDPMRSVIEI